MAKEEIASRARRIMKLIRLAQNPMLDRVAIRLNSELTYEEERQAERWSLALTAAQNLRDGDDIFEAAANLYEKNKPLFER